MSSVSRPKRWTAALLLAFVSLAGPLSDRAEAQASEDEADMAAVDAARAEAEAEARMHFEDARLAFSEGRNEVALQEFQRAYELSGRPELLYNIALVHDRLRHDREALASFQQFLAEVPGTEYRTSVESRIRVLEEEIAREEALATAAGTADSGSGEEVWESPIFWTLLGVVVVGAGVGIGVGVALSQDPGTAPVVPGPSGVVITALSF
jgi:tetratricopeptide (TPR) repeat protein